MGLLRQAFRRLPFVARRRAARAARDAEEQRFLDECWRIVDAWATQLEASGVATVTRDPAGGEGPPPWIEVIPNASGAVEAWIGFDYPSFCLAFPHADAPNGVSMTAELFGTFEERLIEVRQRLDAIAAGRLDWEYDADRSRVQVSWRSVNGEPFLRTSYRGASQLPTNASGSAAPYVA